MCSDTMYQRIGVVDKLKNHALCKMPRKLENAHLFSEHSFQNDINEYKMNVC